ncbi:MAG: single-stranded DNA-binding protein [SAR324 cluster bacterium]|uniref:Single-stranded DNA-binding protein n=1 Tax=SAR324 cluster bacterium TaxID=2024889 RepID=A0A7X9FRT4_9DELT|nr:single-stranded DNA-binding protein [SAR324 cluster bacterium]
MGVNKVLLLGRLGKDPDLRFSQNQTPICNFSLATSERRKDANGQWSDHTEWHNIVVFGKTAENCSNYLKKGREVFIEGKIQTRKWQDKEGKDRYTTEILAQTVQFVGSKSDAASASASFGNNTNGVNPFEDLKSADEISATVEEVNFEDDDIPF